ncbi:MAG TPA: protein kinase, partial [Dermatophilaceae bacterium]|nr:protein kinase [Dermatophilaceae bacterium]
MAVGKDSPATPRPEGGSRVEDGDAPDGYENLTRIDQGGFAVVYRGRDTRFDRTVALKILRADSLGERQLRRFRAECLAIGRVSSHPNIVTVYDAGTTRGHRPWLAMEYCSGGSLAHKLARVGPLPVAEVVSIGTRLCGALSAAHGGG